MRYKSLEVTYFEVFYGLDKTWDMIRTTGGVADHSTEVWGLGEAGTGEVEARMLRTRGAR